MVNSTKSDGKVSGLQDGFPQFFGQSHGVWERENTFINDNIYLRQGFGYDLNNQSIPDNSNTSGSKIKILIFGDSFTWGNGNIDPNSTIGSMLKRRLNKSAGGDIFEVRVLAKNGTSLMSHYDFLKEYDLKGYNPDLVIYNYYFNDHVPNFTETLVCGDLSIKECQDRDPKLNPLYQSCQKGRGDFISSLISRFKVFYPYFSADFLSRHCSKYFVRLKDQSFDEVKLLKDPFKSPFINEFRESARLVREIFAGYKLAVANLVFLSNSEEVDSKIMSLFEEDGYSVVKMSRTHETMKSPRNDDFLNTILVNPGNAHSSSYLNNIYTEDMSDFIFSYISDSRINEALKLRRSNLDSNREEGVVDFTMPVFDSKVIRLGKESSRVIFSKSFEDKYNQRDSLSDNLPFQYVPCSELSRPYYIFTLRDYSSNRFLKVEGLKNLKDFEFGFFYYDEDFKRTYKEVEFSSRMPIPESKLPPSFVLSLKESELGCFGDKEISFPDFNIVLSLFD